MKKKIIEFFTNIFAVVVFLKNTAFFGEDELSVKTWNKT